jgi:hypothetical protein
MQKIKHSFVTKSLPGEVMKYGAYTGISLMAVTHPNQGRVF